MPIHGPPPSLIPLKPLESLDGAVPLLCALAVPSGDSAFENKLCLLASATVMGSPRLGGVQGWDTWQSGMLDGAGPQGLDPERAGLGKER